MKPDLRCCLQPHTQLLQVAAGSKGAAPVAAGQPSAQSTLAREQESVSPSKAAQDAEHARRASNGTAAAVGAAHASTKSNGTGGATSASAEAIRQKYGVDISALDAAVPYVGGDADPCEAGQLASCANLRMNEREIAALDAERPTSDVRTCAAVCSQLNTGQEKVKVVRWQFAR